VKVESGKKLKARLPRLVLVTVREIRSLLFGLPGIVHFSSRRGLNLIKEVSEILDSLGVMHFIAGGFAYDIKRGRLTRYHSDLDVVVLDEGGDVGMEGSFARNGFRFVTQKHNSRIIKHGRSTDLFFCRKSVEGYLETRDADTVIRMPASCFYSETKRLYGTSYKVASDDYIVCIEPLVLKKSSKEYIKHLTLEVPLTCRVTEEGEPDFVKVYEYRRPSVG
jgi:hypothetical protein